jgi:hypothetical protein
LLTKLIEIQRIPIDLMLGLVLKIFAMSSILIDNAVIGDFLQKAKICVLIGTKIIFLVQEYN